ncbi:hypothetical protein [Streptomyces sp. NPDC097640]
MTKHTDAAAGTEAVPRDGGGAVVNLADGWEGDNGDGRRPED